MKAKSQRRTSLGRLVAQFMAQMHRFDDGRTLPIFHQSRLTTPQFAALEFLAHARTISALAAHLGLSLPATSQMVQKLVSLGLIVRSEGTVDRREKQVMLAPPGHSLLASVAAARAARFEASLSALPAPVASRLEAVLRECVDALGDKARH